MSISVLHTRACIGYCHFLLSGKLSLQVLFCALALWPVWWSDPGNTTVNHTQVPPGQGLPGLVEETEAVTRYAISAGLERSTGNKIPGHPGGT